MDARRATICALLVHAASVCAAPPPIEDLFRPPSLRNYSISPDGRFLVEAMRADRADADRIERYRSADDLRNLKLPPQRVYLGDMRAMRFNELDLGPGASWVFDVRWLDARTLLWHVRDLRSGSQRVEVREVREMGATASLGPARILGSDVHVLAASTRDAPALVVAGADGDEKVYRVSLQLPLFVQMVPANLVAGPFRGVQNWIVAGDGSVRAVGLRRRGNELRVLTRADDASPWRRVATLPDDDLESNELVGIDDASGALQMVSDTDSDKSVLRELDPKSGAFGRVLVEDPRNDVSGAILDPRSGKVVGGWLDDASTSPRFVEAGLRTAQAQAELALPGRAPRIVAYSDDRRFAVAYTGRSDDPGEFHYLDLANHQAVSLGGVAPWLEGAALARTEPIEFKARDGLAVHAQFTRPVGGGARPPLVLMPHGGPFGVRDYDRFDPNVQFLASRGYAVLQVDFRGSAGYGRAFRRAGFKRWGAEMQLDLMDALDMVVKRGWVDESRVCVFGGSYGGYAAMMSAIQEPQRFRCAITYAGVSDLTLFIKSDELRDMPFLNQARFEYLKKAIGDPEKDRELLESRSPAFIAGGMQVPVFIVHGEDDERVVPEHAYRLRAAIEAGGGTVEWLMVPHEGHGFRLLENVSALYERLGSFLAQHLASAAAPATAR